MRLIYARYNPQCNSIDVTTFENVVLRIDCNKAEEGLRTTPGSQCSLNALAIDNPLEYARLYLDGEMQVYGKRTERHGRHCKALFQESRNGSRKACKSSFRERLRTGID